MPHTMHSQAGDVGAAEYLDAFDISSSAGDTSIYFGSFIIGAAEIPAENLPAVRPSRVLRRIVTFGNQMKGHLIAELMATQTIAERHDTLAYISAILAARSLPALELPTAEEIQAVTDALANRQPTPGNRAKSPEHEQPATLVNADGSALTRAVPPQAPPSGLANAPLAPAPAPAPAPDQPAEAAAPLAQASAAHTLRAQAQAARVPHQVGASR